MTGEAPTQPVVRCRAEGCSRLLRDPASVLLGYGPVCAGRLRIGYLAPKAARTTAPHLSRRPVPAHPVEAAPDQLALWEAS